MTLERVIVIVIVIVIERNLVILNLVLSTLHCVLFVITQIYYLLNEVAMHTGKIKSIIGVVIDVEFSEGYVPNIYDALEVQSEPKIIVEVQQQLGDNTVRTIAMNPVDGLQRGLDVVALE